MSEKPANRPKRQHLENVIHILLRNDNIFLGQEDIQFRPR